MAPFFPCSKNFLKDKLKINELISLTEEVLRQSNIDSVVWLQPMLALKELRRERRGQIQAGIKEGEYKGQDHTQPSHTQPSLVEGEDLRISCSSNAVTNGSCHDCHSRGQAPPKNAINLSMLSVWFWLQSHEL